MVGRARLHLLQCRPGRTIQNRGPVTHSWCSAQSRLSHGDFFRNEVVSRLLKFSKSICSSGAVMTAGAEPLRVFCPLGLSKMWNGPNLSGDKHFSCLQVRTLFVSGLPVDIKPRELYLLFRPFKVSEIVTGCWWDFHVSSNRIRFCLCGSCPPPQVLEVSHGNLQQLVDCLVYHRSSSCSWTKRSPVNSSVHICIYGNEATPLFVYCSGFGLDSSSTPPPLPVSYLTKLEAVSLAHGWSCGMCKWVALMIGQPKPLRDPVRPPCRKRLISSYITRRL